MTFTFEIIGEPQGKGRPRFSTRGGFVKTYTPEKTASYENFVKLCYLNKYRGQKLDGEIIAEIIAYFSIPNSFSKKKRAEAIEGKIKPTKKPDTDNIAKTILDSLNGIAFEDDKQVVSLSVKKLYGEEPKVVVVLENEEGSEEE